MYIQIKPLLIEVDGPLAVNTGFRRGLIHRTVERDADGLAYIPASSLKGRVRRACEQIAKRIGLQVCHSPHPGGMCSAHTKQTCLVCRIFGSPGRTSTLHWQDARLTQSYRKVFSNAASRQAQFYSRTYAQLSRALGIAAPDHLFTSEFTIENLRFESAITGWLDVTPIAGEKTTGGYELLLLLAGLKMVNTLGSSSSRGIGRSSIELPGEIKIEDLVISTKTILENFDLLGEFAQEVQNDA
ncbi:MAG TPA: RAMP superfamily CRISPR-associated protein [Thermosynergistes sp.]|nr:RAMP superfamily CRISPR-associated protein [Thermosynergistes sp.]